MVEILAYASFAISVLTAAIVAYLKLAEYLYLRRLDRLKKSRPCKGDSSDRSMEQRG